MSTRLRSSLFALVLIAIACVLRWPGVDRTIWNPDEGAAFTMAEVIRNGGVLYRDAADHRTPLLPYGIALIMEVVGDWNIRGTHIVLAVMLGLTAVCLWRVGRQGKDEATGVIAAIYFTFLSFIMLGTGDAMTVHTGWFLVFFSALGMWAFVAAFYRESGWLAGVAGTAFAFGALSKQPGVLDWGVCLVLCALVAWITPARRHVSLRLAVMSALGFAGLLAASCWYFAAHGAWHDFIEYSWTYNTQIYVPEVPFYGRLKSIRMPLHLARENAPFAYWLGIMSAGGLLVAALPNLWKRPNKFSVLPWLILGWSASGLVSTVLSGRNFGHYSIQVLPGLSLACGWVTVRCWERSAAWKSWGAIVGKWSVRAGLGLCLLSLVRTAVLRTNSFELSEGIGKDMGLVVKARTRTDERIFVWGYEPELHAYAERLPNTRFLYANFLTGMIPWTNLDALKNTDYAVVPGAWDAFWQDFTRRPPAMIVDTRGNRGYLKYPLRHQTRLWNIIESQYVEVAVDYANSRGYSLYQRATLAPEADLSILPEDGRLQVSSPERTQLRTISISVKAPDKTTAIDLYLDGRPYRRIGNPDHRAVQTSFFLLGSDLTTGSHWLKAVARGLHDIASASHPFTVDPGTAVPQFTGPALNYAGREIMPVESETVTGQPVTLRQARGQWDAFAPSRLVYPRPDGLANVNFTFGIFAEAYNGSMPQKTDGVDVSVFFEDDNGRQTQLYRRNLDPVNNASDRTLLSGHAALPGSKGGKIIFLTTPGPMNIAAYDWSYWRSIDGDSPFPGPKFRGQPVPLIDWNAQQHVSVMYYRDSKVQMIHAPSHFAFRQLAGMTELSGEFGLLDEAWAGPQQTNGAVFEIDQVLPTGKSQTLFQSTLYPGNKPDDREIKSFHISLVYAEGSLIRFTTSAVNPANNLFNYTFWHDLAIGEFTAHLTFEGRTVNSIQSEAVNGLNYMDEEGVRVLLAHAPSQIVFPVEPLGKRLQGVMGLLRGAYTGKDRTDGAVFVVEVESKEGKRNALFRRYLNPRDNPADQGAVPFIVDLPAEAEGSRIILRTECAPSGRLNFAWSYWHDLRLVP